MFTDGMGNAYYFFTNYFQQCPVRKLHSQFFPLQGGGQEGDGVDFIDATANSAHPHPDPPLEREGDFKHYKKLTGQR